MEEVRLISTIGTVNPPPPLTSRVHLLSRSFVMPVTFGYPERERPSHPFLSSLATSRRTEQPPWIIIERWYTKDESHPPLPACRSALALNPDLYDLVV